VVLRRDLRRLVDDDEDRRLMKPRTRAWQQRGPVARASGRPRCDQTVDLLRWDQPQHRAAPEMLQPIEEDGPG